MDFSDTDPHRLTRIIFNVLNLCESALICVFFKNCNARLSRFQLPAMQVCNFAPLCFLCVLCEKPLLVNRHKPSSVVKVDNQSGDLVPTLHLPSSIYCEGISIYHLKFDSLGNGILTIDPIKSSTLSSSKNIQKNSQRPRRICFSCSFFLRRVSIP